MHFQHKLPTPPVFECLLSSFSARAYLDYVIFCRNCKTVYTRSFIIPPKRLRNESYTVVVRAKFHFVFVDRNTNLIIVAMCACVWCVVVDNGPADSRTD